jgi:hypothetical protein
MKVIEIKNKSIKVTTADNQTMLVAKYTDNGGVFFYNENLEKQYATIEAPVPKAKTKRTSNLKKFEFMVEYAHNGNGTGRATSFPSTYATTYEIALARVSRRFKAIIDISEC